MQSREHANAAGGPPGAVGRNIRQPTVLCVRQRDDARIRRLVQALQAHPHDCQSGGEALAVARSRALTCIIAPLEMPDMPARELIERLPEVAPGLAVIVIVDNPAVSEAVAVMRSGAHAVVDSRILGRGLLPHLTSLLRGA